MINSIDSIKKTWFFWKNRYHFLKNSELSSKSTCVSFCRDQGDNQFCLVASKDRKSLVDIIDNNTTGILIEYILAIRAGDKILAMRKIVEGLKQFKLALKSDPVYSKIADELIWDEVDK